MFSHILVPHDGSTHADFALTTAATMIDGVEGAKITVLRTVLPKGLSGNEPKPRREQVSTIQHLSEEAAQEVYDSYVKESQEKFALQVEEALESRHEGIEFDYQVRVSTRPQDEIISYAHEHMAELDCIVMGRRGLGALRTALGSVSFAVLQGSELPVMLVK